jgi:hypothetical protein
MISVQSEPVPSVQNLTEGKKFDPDMFDRLNNLFTNSTEVPKRSLATEKVVVPEPAFNIAVAPESGLKSKQAGLNVPIAEPNHVATVQLPSFKFKKDADASQAGLVAKESRAALELERRIDPVLGRSLRLGNTLEVASGNICIKKGSHHLIFCVEAVDWPEEIAAAFRVHTKLFKGNQALVEYNKGKARQFHTLFLAQYFDPIAAYFTKRLGGAAKEFDNWAVIPAEPNRRNRTLRWRGPGSSILEIRQIDDLRWSALPDIKHGAVRIYLDDPAPVFRHVSWSDFTLSRMSRTRQKFCKETNIKPCPW